MAQISLFRHARTASNTGGLFMGRLDVGCSEEGLKAIEAQRLALSLLIPDVVLSSPLERAVTTAKGLFPTHSIQIVDDLTERDLGEWSGLLKDDVRKKYPNAFLKTGKMDAFYCPPQGESWVNFQNRGERILSLLSGYRQGTIVVAVTHNGIIRLLRHLTSKLPADQIFAVDEPFLQPIELHLDYHKKLALR